MLAFVLPEIAVQISTQRPQSRSLLHMFPLYHQPGRRDRKGSGRNRSQCNSRHTICEGPWWFNFQEINVKFFYKSVYSLSSFVSAFYSERWRRHTVFIWWHLIFPKVPLPRPPVEKRPLISSLFHCTKSFFNILKKNWKGQKNFIFRARTNF